MGGGHARIEPKGGVVGVECRVGLAERLQANREAVEDVRVLRRELARLPEKRGGLLEPSFAVARRGGEVQHRRMLYALGERLDRQPRRCFEPLGTQRRVDLLQPLLATRRAGRG